MDFSLIIVAKSIPEVAVLGANMVANLHGLRGKVQQLIGSVIKSGPTYFPRIFRMKSTAAELWGIRLTWDISGAFVWITVLCEVRPILAHSYGKRLFWATESIITIYNTY